MCLTTLPDDLTVMPLAGTPGSNPFQHLAPLRTSCSIPSPLLARIALNAGTKDSNPFSTFDNAMLQLFTTMLGDVDFATYESARVDRVCYVCEWARGALVKAVAEADAEPLLWRCLNCPSYPLYPFSPTSHPA